MRLFHLYFFHIYWSTPKLLEAPIGSHIVTWSYVSQLLISASRSLGGDNNIPALLKANYSGYEQLSKIRNQYIYDRKCSEVWPDDFVDY